jgi:hypothetical protein
MYGLKVGFAIAKTRKMRKKPKKGAYRPQYVKAG